jgi:hypothetical protein
MELIDEKGRLLGRINVVDALVVLVVLAVLLAGVALVTGGGDAGPGGPGEPNGTTAVEEAETRYATLALGAHPAWVAASIHANDTVAVAGINATANVTDVYLTGTDDGQTVTFARVGYPEGALRAGTTVTVAGDDYRTEATVRAAGANRSTLRTATTPVVITTTLGPDRAAALSAGDRYTVGNETLATVESVTSVPTGGSERRRLQLGVALETLTVDGEPRFAGRTLRVGTAVPLRTGAVDGFGGTVAVVGSTEPAGDPTDVTMTVVWEDVRPDVADALSTGAAESHRGATARVTGVTSTPATVVRANEAGELFVREHPRNRDVTLTVDATARRTGSELRFHGRSLSEGRTVTLEFDSISISGVTLDFETDE